jgi:hypothetical protein
MPQATCPARLCLMQATNGAVNDKNQMRVVARLGIDKVIQLNIVGGERDVSVSHSSATGTFVRSLEPFHYSVRDRRRFIPRQPKSTFVKTSARVDSFTHDRGISLVALA